MSPDLERFFCNGCTGLLSLEADSPHYAYALDQTIKAFGTDPFWMHNIGTAVHFLNPETKEEIDKLISEHKNINQPRTSEFSGRSQRWPPTTVMGLLEPEDPFRRAYVSYASGLWFATAFPKTPEDWCSGTKHKHLELLEFSLHGSSDEINALSFRKEFLGAEFEVRYSEFLQPALKLLIGAIPNRDTAKFVSSLKSGAPTAGSFGPIAARFEVNSVQPDHGQPETTECVLALEQKGQIFGRLFSKASPRDARHLGSQDHAHYPARAALALASSLMG